MGKNILIINSRPEYGQALAELLEDFGPEYDFFLLRRATEETDEMASLFASKKWPVKSAYFGRRLGGGAAASLIFFISFPLFFASFFLRLLLYRKRYRLAAIVCLGLNEKLLATLAASILKIKVSWLELPDEETVRGGTLAHYYRFCAKRATIACFFNFSRERMIKQKIRPENIVLAPPGVKLHNHKFQENIFSNLAHLEAGQKKFFSVGIVADLEGSGRMSSFEALFRAVKISLSVAPNLQLIVVGDGKERKNLIWLAKKLEIESLVWFVGRQAHLKKWLDGFDVLVAVAEQPKFADLTLVLRSMANEVPVIAPDSWGFDELIEDGKTGFLTNTDDSDKIAEKIICLRRDRRLLERLGVAAREQVEKNHYILRTVEEIKKII